MRPTIFVITAAWDGEASVWTGRCDDLPAAAAAPTLDDLLVRIREMALDILPDNHPDLDPEGVYFQLNALTGAMPDAA